MENTRVGIPSSWLTSLYEWFHALVSPEREREDLFLKSLYFGFPYITPLRNLPTMEIFLGLFLLNFSKLLIESLLTFDLIMREKFESYLIHINSV